MTGVELFVQILKSWDVPFVATLCGHGMDGFDEACHRAGLPLVDVRNEQAAGYMAETYGRLTGRIGVCAVSSGVAHANGLTGVLNALFDGAPMLLITGCGPTETIGKGHFQDFDQVGMAASVCKYTAMIFRPEHIPHILHTACNTAVNGRPGPVHITFPIDIQTSEVDPEVIKGYEKRPDRISASGDADLVDKAALLISCAKRPLLIAGGGVHYAQGAAALGEFAGVQGIPVMTPIWDRGSVPNPRKEYVGVCGAATGGPDLLAQADLLIMAGAACDYRVGYLESPGIADDAQVIRIDVDPVQLHQGLTADVSILGDPGSVLMQLAAACGRQDYPPHREWMEEAAVQRLTYTRRCIESRRLAEEGTHALDIVEAVKSVLTDDTIIIVDGGNIGQWCHQVLFDRYPAHWLTCGASGVVGYGLPAAMTARLLYPERQIILISGDGSITFTIAELETAARQKLGFTVLLADDQAWGITLTGHLRSYGEGITSELGPIQFAQVAQGFGAGGYRVDKAEDIEPLLRQSLEDRKKPTLIHIPVVRSNPSEWKK